MTDQTAKTARELADIAFRLINGYLDKEPTIKTVAAHIENALDAAIKGAIATTTEVNAAAVTTARKEGYQAGAAAVREAVLRYADEIMVRGGVTPEMLDRKENTLAVSIVVALHNAVALTGEGDQPAQDCGCTDLRKCMNGDCEPAREGDDGA